MVINRRRALTAVCGGLLALLIGCTPTTGTPSASPGSATLDFTAPGVAKAMVTRLLTEAGSEKALMVTITAASVQVTVLEGEKPTTWAYRDGKSAEVASDLQWVDQATFEVAKFNFADVGAMFRAAAGQSGSATNQTLSIVDPSGGDVVMSVSTQPETRPVFFNPDGSLTPILDFDTLTGLSAGIKDAIGTRALVYSVTVISDQSVSAEFPGADDTTERRTRGSKVPTVTTQRSSADLRQFPTARLNPAIIWQVVNQVRGSQEVANGSKWSVTIDNREKLALPRMYFAFGFKVVVADLDGTIIGE